MKLRYSIWVREYQSDHDVELMQVNSSPQEVVRGLREKKLTIRHSIFQGGKTSKVPKYTLVRIVENTND
jgi:hypothetical protein